MIGQRHSLATGQLLFDAAEPVVLGGVTAHDVGGELSEAILRGTQRITPVGDR